MSARDLVASIVDLAGGRVTGRVRMQKIAYLLQRKGAAPSLSFAYHHFGPYSRELDEGIAAAKALGRIREATERRASDGAPYSVFMGVGAAPASDDLGPVSRDEAARLVARMTAADVSSTIIELAATIDWLRSQEGVTDWRSELVRRKSVKTNGGRVEQALVLLRELGLDAPEAASAT
jgi:uncharacterized protein